MVSAGGLFWAGPSQPTHTTNGPTQAFQGVLTFSEYVLVENSENQLSYKHSGWTNANVTFAHMAV